MRAVGMNTRVRDGAALGQVARDPIDRTVDDHSPLTPIQGRGGMGVQVLHDLGAKIPVGDRERDPVGTGNQVEVAIVASGQFSPGAEIRSLRSDDFSLSDIVTSSNI